jgi:hypothetical protein
MDDLTPVSRTPEHDILSVPDAAIQRRLARAADARHQGSVDPYYERTLRGLMDVDAGRLVEDAAMEAWANSLGSGSELPPP